MTLIMTIDPGPVLSAFIIMNELKVIEYGIVPNDELLNNQWRIHHAGWRIDHCSIEMIASYGMAVGKTVHETCVWIGRYIERWYQFSTTTPDLFYRKEIVTHLCHSSKGGDSNVRQALIDRYGEPGKKANPNPITYGISKDVWSALAIAAYKFDQLKQQQTTAA